MVKLKEIRLILKFFTLILISWFTHHFEKHFKQYLYQCYSIFYVLKCPKLKTNMIWPRQVFIPESLDDGPVVTAKKQSASKLSWKQSKVNTRIIGNNWTQIEAKSQWKIQISIDRSDKLYHVWWSFKQRFKWIHAQVSFMTKPLFENDPNPYL